MDNLGHYHDLNAVMFLTWMYKLQHTCRLVARKEGRGGGGGGEGIGGIDRSPLLLDA